MLVGGEGRIGPDPARGNGKRKVDVEGRQQGQDPVKGGRNVEEGRKKTPNWGQSCETRRKKMSGGVVAAKLGNDVFKSRGGRRDSE